VQSGKKSQDYWKDTFKNRAQTATDTIARNGFLLKVGTARVRETVLDLIGPVSALDILDAGCGDGSVSFPLTAMNRVTGLDIVPGMLELASARGIIPVEGSMEEPPFPAHSFDLVMSVEVISLSDRPFDVITSLAKLVRPGGRLIISCVNKASLFRAAAERILDVVRRPYPNAIHMSDLYVAVEKSGFDVLRMRSIISGPGFAVSVTPRKINSPVLNIANNIIIEARAT